MLKREREREREIDRKEILDHHHIIVMIICAHNKETNKVFPRTKKKKGQENRKLSRTGLH
jgi:hypothetical protein